jgi:DNA-binding Lrp family transcriptional regulator
MIGKNDEIIFLYGENARIKLKEVAKQLRSTPQRISYHIEQLKKNNILQLPHAIFDYSYFGLLLFKVYLTGGYLTEQEKKRIADTLKSHHSVVAIYDLEGEADQCIEIISPNPSAFNKTLKELSKEFSDLADYKIVLNVVTHIYPKRYLMPAYLPEESEIVIGGDRPVRIFTEQEKEVIKATIQNPLQASFLLAKKAGLHPTTFKKTRKALEEEKIFRGVKYLIDTQQLGFERVRLLISTKNFTLEQDTNFLKLLKDHPNVVKMHRTIGDWNLEIDLEAKTRAQLRKTIIELKEAFSEVMKELRTAEIYQYHKRFYLPRNT